MSSELSTGKTIFILAVVVGCFAILWPKVFYPMLTASVKHTPKQVPHWKDPATSHYLNQLCFLLEEHRDPVTGLERWSDNDCFEAVKNSCRIDLTEKILEGFRHSKDKTNLTECLFQRYNLTPEKVSSAAPPPTRARTYQPHTTVHPHARPERPSHLHPEQMHPALREKGRTMPQRTIEKEARPGPMPGIRPPMGGGGHMVPPQTKGSGAMGIIMPLYTVGIVVFFVYTIMKVLFKKNDEDEKVPKIKDFHMDPEYRKYVFAEEYLDSSNASHRDLLRRQEREASRLRRRQEMTPPDTKIDSIGGHKEGIPVEDEQMDQLRRRLEDTERAMERLMSQMGSVTDKLTAAKITEVLTQAQAQAKILKMGLDDVLGSSPLEGTIAAPPSATTTTTTTTAPKDFGDGGSDDDMTTSETCTNTLSEDFSLPIVLQRHLRELQVKDFYLKGTSAGTFASPLALPKDFASYASKEIPKYTEDFLYTATATATNDSIVEVSNITESRVEPENDQKKSDVLNDKPNFSLMSDIKNQPSVPTQDHIKDDTPLLADLNTNDVEVLVDVVNPPISYAPEKITENKLQKDCKIENEKEKEDTKVSYVDRNDPSEEMKDNIFKVMHLPMKLSDGTANQKQEIKQDAQVVSKVIIKRISEPKSTKSKDEQSTPSDIAQYDSPDFSDDDMSSNASETGADISDLKSFADDGFVPTASSASLPTVEEQLVPEVTFVDPTPEVTMPFYPKETTEPVISVASNKDKFPIEQEKVNSYVQAGRVSTPGIEHGTQTDSEQKVSVMNVGSTYYIDEKESNKPINLQEIEDRINDIVLDATVPMDTQLLVQEAQVGSSPISSIEIENNEIGKPCVVTSHVSLAFVGMEHSKSNGAMTIIIPGKRNTNLFSTSSKEIEETSHKIPITKSNGNELFDQQSQDAKDNFLHGTTDKKTNIPDIQIYPSNITLPKEENPMTENQQVENIENKKHELSEECFSNPSILFESTGVNSTELSKYYNIKDTAEFEPLPQQYKLLTTEEKLSYAQEECNKEKSVATDTAFLSGARPKTEQHITSNEIDLLQQSQNLSCSISINSQIEGEPDKIVPQKQLESSHEISVAPEIIEANTTEPIPKPGANVYLIAEEIANKATNAALERVSTLTPTEIRERFSSNSNLKLSDPPTINDDADRSISEHQSIFNTYYTDSKPLSQFEYPSIDFTSSSTFKNTVVENDEVQSNTFPAQSMMFDDKQPGPMGEDSADALEIPFFVASVKCFPSNILERPKTPEENYETKFALVSREEIKVDQPNAVDESKLFEFNAEEQDDDFLASSLPSNQTQQQLKNAEEAALMASKGMTKTDSQDNVKQGEENVVKIMSNSASDIPPQKIYDGTDTTSAEELIIEELTHSQRVGGEAAYTVGAE